MTSLTPAHEMYVTRGSSLTSGLKLSRVVFSLIEESAAFTSLSAARSRSVNVRPHIEAMALTALSTSSGMIFKSTSAMFEPRCGVEMVVSDATRAP
jgi:hypothetical protein